MKTAISIPDEVFQAAEEAAKYLGVSRSELYTNAVRDYIAHHRAENITAKLNEVYAELESSLDPHTQKMQAVSMAEQGDW